MLFITGSLWILVTILGPILLLGSLIWLYFSNRKPRPEEVERAEKGAKELREDIKSDPNYTED